MMSICCVIVDNEESSGRPDQDDRQWHGRPRTCRQTSVSLVSSILLFAFSIHKTACIPDSTIAAIPTSSNVERTAFDVGVGGVRPCSRNNDLTTDKINLLAVELLLCCGVMGIIAATFRCTVIRHRTSLVVCLYLLARARSASSRTRRSSLRPFAS